MEPEIITPPKLDDFLVHYQITYRGEVSGMFSVGGWIVRPAIDADTALQEVHLLFSKLPMNVYFTVDQDNLRDFSYLVRMRTPEFPPGFSGRTIRTISVCLEHTWIRQGKSWKRLKQIPASIPHAIQVFPNDQAQ